MQIKSQKDFFAGLMYLGVGIAFAIGATNYKIGDGARMAYLQVDESNVAARALYARFGFSTAYHYWYRAREGDQH